MVLPARSSRSRHRAVGVLRHPHGFALITTIVLVAFLVLILVALATFIRVETQVAENVQNLAKARQNALFALNIAMGELQRSTGPDQRVTVTADIGTVGDGDPATPDNGLPAATDGTYAWTGVLGNGTNPVNPIDARKAAHTGETPVLLNWLVSGNEGVAFTVSTAAGSFGQITAGPPASGAGAIRFGPGSTINGLGATSTATSPITITPTGGGAARPAALLVGPGSASNDVDPSSPQANYVVAPLVDIEVPTAQVPGLGSAEGNTTIGRYAWWVGDEGVKARVNLEDPNRHETSGDAARLRTLVVARAGTEAVGGFADLDVLNAPLARVLTDRQLPFLPVLSGRPPLTPAATRARFHDITPYSVGVLANVATGGLKKDLTAGLLGASQPNEVSDAEPLFTPPAVNPSNGSNTTEAASLAFGSSNLNALRTPAWSVTAPATTVASSGPAAWPNWGKVRSYVRLQDQVAGAGESIAPRVGTDSQMAVHPVVTRFQLFIVAFAENSGGDNPGLRAAYLPALVLWNPYDVTLEAADYGFYYEADYTAFSGNDANRIPSAWNIGAPYVQGGVPSWPSFVAVHSPGGRDDRYVFPGYNPVIHDPENAQAAEAWTNRRTLRGQKWVSERMGERKGLRFVIRSGPIPPGEAIVFTPSATQPLQEDPTQNIMTPGWRVAAFTERFVGGIPAGNRVRYVLGTWPRDLSRHQRFSLGLGGTFSNGPAGVPQIPDNLLQTVSGISSSQHSSLDNDRSPHVTRWVKYSGGYEEPIEGVGPLPENGSAAWVPPGALVVSSNTGPHTTRFPEWDPSWEGGEIEEILSGNSVPPATALNFVFRMEHALPHTDLRPAQIGAGGAPGAARGMRWLGSLNPLAGALGRSAVEAPTGNNDVGGGYVANPLFPYAGILDYHGDNFITHQPTRFTIPTWDTALTRTFVGSSSGRVLNPENPAATVDGARRLIVRHLPRSANGVLSIGALQHADLHPATGRIHAPPANLSASVPNGYAAGHMPTNAVGNSLIDPLVHSADVDGFPNNWNNITSTNLRSEARWLRTHFDLSLVSNRALWDRYYFSGVPRSGSIASRNPRLQLHDPDSLLAAGDSSALSALRDFNSAASRQLVAGSFNINSTSREAWIALLSSTRDAAVPGFTAETATSPILRVNGAIGDAFETAIPASGLPTNRIHQSDRFRSLTDAQIAALADQIVDEIRARGPALTLAGFVNRNPRAAGDPESADALQRRLGFQRYLGPLQTAIDRVRTYQQGNVSADNVTYDGSGAVATFTGINDNLMRELVVNSDTANSNSLNRGRVTFSTYLSRMALGAHREITGGANGVMTTGPNFIIADAPLALRSRAYGMPGYLTQADILQLLGPVLSARSDTFRIRTYGEVTNPATGATVARAWLEVIVQRLPEFVDPTDDPSAWRPNDSRSAANAWNPATTHRPANLEFGRRYRVVHFRWLDAPDV